MFILITIFGLRDGKVVKQGQQFNWTEGSQQVLQLVQNNNEKPVSDAWMTSLITS